jgi:hypothetical protein
MTNAPRLSRRSALKLAAASTALPLVHIRSAGAAGKLSIALTDIFVPNASEFMGRLIENWGERTKVEAHATFPNNISNQLVMAQAAEAQAGAGHDVMYFNDYDVAAYADTLEPVGDVVNLLEGKNGPLAPGVEQFARLDGTWRAVPTSWQSLYWPSETRIDLLRQQVGLDVLATFPVASEMGPGYEQWTWDAFLLAAEKCFRAGYAFGLPISNCTDANGWIDPLFRSYGAELVDAAGNIIVRSDPTREVLDYSRRLAQFLPPDVYTYNNASNNRALISGRSALIFNPPSAWAAAVQDNPAVGAQIWHHPFPAGKHGRYGGFFPGYFGIWNFSENKSAAKDLIVWLSERQQVEAECAAERGFDIPPFVSMTDFPIWAEAGPPKGTLFNYPLKPAHGASASVAGAPAPSAIARQIKVQWVLPKMVARVTQSGMSIEDSISLAERELEGFMR